MHTFELTFPGYSGKEQGGTEAQRAERFRGTDAWSDLPVEDPPAGPVCQLGWIFLLYCYTNDQSTLENLTQITQHVTLLQHVSTDKLYSENK